MKSYAILIGVLFVLPSFAFGATPTIASYTQSASFVNSGQPLSFSWSIPGGYGYSFTIPCIEGIKFKKTIGGGDLSCGTAVTETTITNSGIDIVAWNLGGASRAFTARLIPLDENKAPNTQGQQDLYVTVQPAVDTIESLVGTSTVLSGAPYTLSWTSKILDGVNLSISCNPLISATSSTATNTVTLPCNTPLFGTDLSGSGSATFYFNNSASQASEITISVLPAMATKLYNGGQKKSVTVSVESNVAPDPFTSSFTSQPIISGATTDTTLQTTSYTASWVTEKSIGANMRIFCNENVTTMIITNTSSTTPKCNTLAFEIPLIQTGTSTIIFTNKGYANETMTISLIPERKNGTYDATRGKVISLLAMRRGSLSAETPAPSPALQKTTAATATAIGASTPTASIPTKVFLTKYLSRGASGAEIRALQEYLAKDASIYPEKSVSGYFGPATERAVKKFQATNKIATAGSAGYGAVGPKTRALLNTLMNQ